MIHRHIQGICLRTPIHFYADRLNEDRMLHCGKIMRPGGQAGSGAGEKSLGLLFRLEAGVCISSSWPNPATGHAVPEQIHE